MVFSPTQYVEAYLRSTENAQNFILFEAPPLFYEVIRFCSLRDLLVLRHTTPQICALVDREITRRTSSSSVLYSRLRAPREDAEPPVKRSYEDVIFRGCEEMGARVTVPQASLEEPELIALDAAAAWRRSKLQVWERFQQLMRSSPRAIDEACFARKTIPPGHRAFEASRHLQRCFAILNIRSLSVGETDPGPRFRAAVSRLAEYSYAVAREDLGAWAFDGASGRPLRPRAAELMSRRLGRVPADFVRAALVRRHAAVAATTDGRDAEDPEVVLGQVFAWALAAVNHAGLGRHVLGEGEEGATGESFERLPTTQPLEVAVAAGAPP